MKMERGDGEGHTRILTYMKRKKKETYKEKK